MSMLLSARTQYEVFLPGIGHRSALKAMLFIEVLFEATQLSTGRVEERKGDAPTGKMKNIPRQKKKTRRCTYAGT